MLKWIAGGLVVALSLAGCATPPAHETSARYEAANEVARIAGELLRSHYRADGPGAAILVARGDTVLFRGARGEASLETHLPLRPNAVFRVGSITKQFTAAALLTLVEDGKVRLDDPLSRYLPHYPGGERITLAQLLNHTAGIRNYTELPSYAGRPASEDFTTSQLVDFFRNEQPDFAPGENWAYSNSGYVLIGAVIEQVTGMPWYEYLQQRFFRPLGMAHTRYGDDAAFAFEQVQGYSYEGANVVRIGPMSMTRPHAAGGLVSNVDDLLVWSRALHEGRLLHNETYMRMITPEGPAAREGVSYGYGFYVNSVRGFSMLRHGGRISGFIASLSYVPGPDITVVVLENDDEHNGVEEADALARRLVAAALGDPYPDMREAPVDEASLHAMEGVFGFDGGVRRTLRVVDGRLTAQRDAGPRVALTPIGEDDFLYADSFNRLRIERDATGVVVAIRLFANGDGAGERGERITSNADSAAVELPRPALDRLVGIYANSQLTMTVALQGDTLFAQIEGQPSFRLLARNATQFEVEEAGASLEFPIGAAPAAQLTIRQNGREMTLERRP